MNQLYQLELKSKIDDLYRMFKLIRLLILLGIISSGIYLAMNPELLSRIEKTPPLLTETELPSHIGPKIDPFKIVAVDEGAGIKEFSINLVQGEISQQLESVMYLEPVPSHLSQTKFENLNTQFHEGTAQIKVFVKDGSLWENTFEQSFEVEFDFTKPRLSVLSQQHIATQGGAEFVLLEAKDTKLQTVGVSVGPYEFEGIHASELDPDFNSTNIYAVLFALPLEIDNPKPIAFARDLVGNTTTSPLNFKIKPYRLKQTTPNVSKEFVELKVRPLYDEFVETMKQEEKVLLDDSNLIKVFKTVNENYRNELQKQLSILTYKRNKLATGTFAKPMASATTSNFGESRSYTVDGASAGRSRHDGLDLASIQRDSVVASNDGIVLLAKHFGIYGETVVLDHGMGLTTLYGHLSSITVSEGDVVVKSQEIGRSGATGLAGGDHLHFEFRIGTAPVTPKEWWDPHWIEDNINGKLSSVKESLSLGQVKP